MWHRRGLMICSTLLAVLSVCSGCGGSGTLERELSDKAREAVFQKRVDLKNRQAPRTKTNSPGRKHADARPLS